MSVSRLAFDDEEPLTDKEAKPFTDTLGFGEVKDVLFEDEFDSTWVGDGKQVPLRRSEKTKKKKKHG